MSSQAARKRALAALEKAGRLTASALVEAAKRKDHPCHNDFIWDDKVAAHHQRMETARAIITSVRVTIRRENITISSPAYVRDPSVPMRTQGHISVARLQTEDDLAAEVMAAEVGRVVQLLNRTRELAMVLDLVDETNAAISAAVVLEEKIKRRRRVDSSGEQRVGA